MINIMKVTMFKPYTPSQLPSVKLEDCTHCYGDSVVSHLILKCLHCSGTGKEPVEMINELTCKHGEVCGQYCSGCSLKYQVGVEFDIIDEDTEWCYDCKEIALDDCHENNHRRGDKILKFLPLRPKINGDNSILMVVKA